MKTSHTAVYPSIESLIRFEWKINFFSHYCENDEEYFPYKCTGGVYRYCIPYNDDTKHLVGTTEEAPDFYKYWED